jgi:subtilase family serine protease
LLAAQQNRHSSQVHKFLTPEQYADRFGLNSADIAKISTWLENNGFTNLQVARSRTWVAFNGTAAQVEASFHTSIHNYLANGEAHFANANDPQLPKALDGVAQGVRGLHNFLMKPRIRLPKPHFTSPFTAKTFLVPDDWTTIYDVKPLYNAGFDGSPISGETYSIAVVGQSDVNTSDLTNFRTAAGLGAPSVTVIIPTGDKDPGLQLKSGDESESDLDLEWSNAIAKNGNIAFVTADSSPDNGVQDAITYVIDQNLAPILSTSYGLCEPQVAESSTDFTIEENLFMQANTQGITIVAASGDDGAADCDSSTTETIATMGLAVDYPASSEFVTGIGGTTLQAEGVGTYFGSSNNSPGQGSALSYIPEATWNDGFQNATGGGVSILVLKPSWQAGTGVPSDGHRDVPDIAFAASPNTDGLLYCTPSTTSGVTTCVNKTFYNSAQNLDDAVTGGTSAGPPSMAGVLAMLVQQTGARLGNINPNLYALASVSHTAFHDITTGNNDVTCEGGSPNCPSLTSTVNGTYGYSAGVGYDQVTGWGSLDAYNFVEQWSSDIQLSPTPATISVNAGSSGTVTVNLSPYKNFPGTSATVSCSVGTGLVNVTCTVGSTGTTSGTAAIPGSQTITITAASNAIAPPRLRLIRNMPPPRPEWLLFALLLALAVSLLRHRRLLPMRAIYAWGAPVLALLSFGVVSCGGGSSSGGSVGVTALAISCTLPATAQVGTAYNGSCSASNGTPPYAYSITSGTLPAGLTLNTSTGAITGTPTAQGTSSFTVTATDSESPAMTASQAVSNFTVAPPAVESGNITVTATSGNIVNTTTIAVTVPSS